MNPPILIRLRFSAYLAAILIAAHGAALLALLSLALPLWAQIVLAMLLLVSLLFYLRRDAWLSAPSSAIALLLEGDRVVLTTRSGDLWPGQLLRDSLVTPLLTVINVLPHGARFARNIIILPDSLDAESFRQLRVWLKWGMGASKKS